MIRLQTVPSLFPLLTLSAGGFGCDGGGGDHPGRGRGVWEAGGRRLPRAVGGAGCPIDGAWSCRSRQISVWTFRPRDSMRSSWWRTTVTPGQTVEGSIDPNGRSLCGLIPMDSLVLELAEENDVAQELASEGMDPILIVLDETGDLMAEAEPWTSPGRAAVRGRLAARSYAVLAGADPSTFGTGEYTSSVEVLTWEGAGPVGVGASVSGVLDATDCMGLRGTPADLWTLSLEEPKALTVDLTRKVFGP